MELEECITACFRSYIGDVELELDQLHVWGLEHIDHVETVFDKIIAYYNIL